MGSSIPIKNIQEINCIKDLYRQKNQISELLMFTLAINTGIDLINLLNLRVKDIKNKKYLCIEKNKSIPLNEEILKLIETVNQKYGNTIIMVTHNDAIKDMADRVVKLRDGMIRKNYLNEHKIPAAELDW